MSIKVNISPYLQYFINGVKTTEVDGSTVGDCLKHLVEQFPTIEKRLVDINGNLLKYCVIFVNGECIYPEGLAKPVKDGDELSIIVVFGGG